MRYTGNSSRRFCPATLVSMLIPTPTQQEIIQLLRAAADISVVAYILYRLILLTKGRRAWQILTGLGVFFLLYFASDWLKLVTLNWLLRQVMPLGPVAIVILFYPELRDVLERLGRADFWGRECLDPRAACCRAGNPGRGCPRRDAPVPAQNRRTHRAGTRNRAGRDRSQQFRRPARCQSHRRLIDYDFSISELLSMMAR